MTNLKSFDTLFSDRHIGPDSKETQKLLEFLNLNSLEELRAETVPSGIRLQKKLRLPEALSEVEALEKLKIIAQKNIVKKSFIGKGYYDCVTPAVIQRNVLENPGWYTQYTPYQAEIAQGRLEALLNFQTLICELTGFSVTNASLLDEATAAAEAMALAYSSRVENAADVFLVAEDCHPQTVAVLETRAWPLKIKIQVCKSPESFTPHVFGVLLQYPGTTGEVKNLEPLIAKARAKKIITTVACDLLALCLLKSPKDLGADIAIGTAQRLGVPLGFGGPHAAYFATTEDHKRKIPGRIVGVSNDKEGRKAMRLALQTREQHIRREKATSNICTAQVLLAVMSSMYAVYHGPEGLINIARKIHTAAATFAKALRKAGLKIKHDIFFDTVTVENAHRFLEHPEFNFFHDKDNSLGVSFDETINDETLKKLIEHFCQTENFDLESNLQIPMTFLRTGKILQQKVFHAFHSESKMMRYIKSLEAKDLSLTHSMIPLGSCTMKLNAAAELMPITWKEFNGLHPFAPKDQTLGYQVLFSQLENMLCEITGFDAVSLQPNSGSQGEYAGLLVIKKYFETRGESRRDVCLIPQSAHGTNPASAAMAGMKVVVIKTDLEGNVDAKDLQEKANLHKENLAVLMITYPSTHGVFEEAIREICAMIHSCGGQVYMDGANMNAQVGICRPADFGADVCHLNLHKTFCIPHGGGGPGMGPIGVKSHLQNYLPTHPVVKLHGEAAIGPVSAAQWSSASILPISWMYIQMMGAEGLLRATTLAILNANYMAERLQPHYPILFRGKKNRVAHECIIDLRPLKLKSNVEVEDVAKRLMDYGFHAPTVSFPIGGTLMIEPTESESKDELDRFCDAMIAIRKEIEVIENGKTSKENNLLKNSPHTVSMVTGSNWDYPYTREEAAFPLPWVRERKFWPSVARIDGAFGDRNLVCTCEPLESYQDS